MNIFNNSIVTATNSLYYDSLLTLISSIHKTSMQVVDKILVYNLGLSDNEIAKLSSIKNTEVIHFSENDIKSHPKFLEPKSYVYKIHCMRDSHKYSNNVLWIDSGAMFLQSCDSIFSTINQEHIFLVGDIHKNYNHTHSNCRNIIEATESELNDTQLWAGLVGYKTNGKYQFFIDQAYKYAMIPGCLDGNQENHRHDQTILSILASRYNIKKHDIDIYGYWTDSNRTMQKAIDSGSIVFAHRRGYNCHKDIVYDK